MSNAARLVLFVWIFFFSSTSWVQPGSWPPPPGPPPLGQPDSTVFRVLKVFFDEVFEDPRQSR